MCLTCSYFTYILFQTLFTRALSRRIRHIRHVQKKKSQPDRPAASAERDEEDVRTEVPQKGNTKKRKISPPFSVPSPSKSRARTSADEYKKHLSELSSEMCKAKPNDKHVQTLLDAIHNNNQHWFSTMDDGELAPILKVLPCYEFGTHVSYMIYTILLIWVTGNWKKPVSITYWDTNYI